MDQNTSFSLPSSRSPVTAATGKLGVLIPGLGAVGTTMIAGVEAAKQGLAAPVGSLTQMGRIRLGKRTENRNPLIKDLAPIAELDDIVFGGWDIYEDNVYQAAIVAKVLDQFIQANQVDKDTLLDSLARDAEGRVRGIVIQPTQLDNTELKDLPRAVSTVVARATKNLDDELLPMLDNNQALARTRLDLVLSREINRLVDCLLYTSPSPRDRTRSRMPSSA